MIPEDQVRLCVVADGAEWIWKHVKALFPHACQVLDYYHCAQYLHNIAKAQYGTSLQGLEWAEATMTRLYLGKVSAVLGGLRRMQPHVRRSRPSDYERLGVSRRAPGAYHTIANSAVGAIRWGVVASNRPTNSFVMCGSSARGPGGMKPTAIRCWRCAVPSITAHWIRCLCGTNSGYGKRQNDRMLPSSSSRSPARNTGACSSKGRHNATSCTWIGARATWLNRPARSSSVRNVASL